MTRKNKYPVLYTSKETVFTHRGLGTLKDCIDPEVIEERNGLFELELTYPVGSFLFDNLIKGNIIKCDVSEALTEQLFRIYRVGKYHNNRIKVIARHISFDSMYDFIENVTLENASCEYALNQIFRASTFCKDFKGYSDIVNAQNYSIQYTNPLSAIGGKSGSIIDTYGSGAEILRDNKNIHVLNSRGKNNSVLIAYRKNLTGLECVEDTTNLITRIFPYAKKTEEANETIITLSEKYVDSPRIFDYEHPFIKEIDFSSQFSNDEEITQTALKLKAEQYFINNKCDIPNLNYKIQFQPLSQTLNYTSDYKCLESVDICDTVIVRDSRYSINTEAKVIKVRRNPITKKIIALELGDPKSSLGSLIGSGGATVGPPGPPGPQGPAGADGNVGDFPDSLPTVPILEAKSIGLASIELTWTYENKAYYKYELYASKTKDFSPDVFDLIFEGQASAFLHQVQPNETWYYRSRAINSHGKATEFSTQVKAETYKISDAAVWFEEAAIGDAFIGTLSADRAWVGKFSGHYIDARNLSVTDGNGKRTLDIDSFGNVNLDVTALKIKSNNVATTQDIDSFKVEVSQSGGDNLLINSAFKKGFDNWGFHQYLVNGSHETWTGTFVPNNKIACCLRANNITEGEVAITQWIDVKANTDYTISFRISQHRCNKLYFTVRKEDSTWIGHQDYADIPEAQASNGDGYAYKTIAFNTLDSKRVCIEIGINSCGNDAYCWMYDPIVCEGKVAKGWQPSSLDGEGYTNSKFEILDNRVTSEISSTNGKLTEYKQDVDGFKFQVERSGGSNLIMNSLGKASDSFWEKFFYSGSVVGMEINGRNDSWTNYCDALQIKLLANASNLDVGVIQKIKVDKGKDYTFKCLVAGHRSGKKIGFTNEGNGAWVTDVWTAGDIHGADSSWHEVVLSFTATENYVNLRLGFTEGWENDAYLWIRDMMLAEGKITQMWQPHSSEVHSTDVSIDNTGLTVKNGNIRIKDNSGNTVLEGDTSGNLTIKGTLKTGMTGKFAEMSDTDTKLYDGTNLKGFIGFRTLDDNSDTCRLALSHNGLNKVTDNYYVVTPYPPYLNPQSYPKAYVDIAYRCPEYQFNGSGDVSNIKMYGDGNIRLSPIKELEVTTNFVNGVYDGETEKRIALFASSASGHYNGHVQIGAVVNKTNGKGLVFEDSRNGNYTAVHVLCDSDQNKYFKPAETTGDVSLGSPSYNWKVVHATNGTIQTSDASDKENIQYISYDESHKIDDVFFISTQEQENERQKHYDFIRGINFAKWDWIDNNIEGLDNLGFIAQDIAGTEVGDRILFVGEDGKYGYSLSNYVTTIAIALQHSIQENSQLKERLAKIEAILGV